MPVLRGNRCVRGPQDAYARARACDSVLNVCCRVLLSRPAAAGERKKINTGSARQRRASFACSRVEVAEPRVGKGCN